MKRFFPVLLLVALAFAACEKQELPAPSANPASTSPAHVEYRITSVSGHMNIEYQVPDGNGAMQTKTATVNRTNFSFKFDMTPGKLLNVSASNEIPSEDLKSEVREKVEEYSTDKAQWLERVEIEEARARKEAAKAAKKAPAKSTKGGKKKKEESEEEVDSDISR